jgi:hypothetical protein
MPATGNPVPNSRARAGVSRTKKEGHTRWVRVVIRNASLWIQKVSFCTLFDRIDVVGRDVNGWGGCQQVCSGTNFVTGQEAISTAKWPDLILGVLEVTLWSERTPQRDYCLEQAVISKPRWDQAIFFNWRELKLSPEVQWSKPKSYEQLLPPMHKLKIWLSTYCCLQVTGYQHTDRFLLLACFPYFEKIKAGLWGCFAVCISPPIIFISVLSVSHQGSRHFFSELVFYFAISGKNCNRMQDLLDARPLLWRRNCYSTTLGCFLSHSGTHTWVLGWLMASSVLKYALGAWKSVYSSATDKAISQRTVDDPFVWDTLLCVLNNHTVLLPRNKHFRKKCLPQI